MARRGPDVFIVGQNIDKHEGYFGRRDGRLVSIGQGVFMKTGANLVEAFRTYGFRIAATKFKQAAITHTCAWTHEPICVFGDDGELASVDVYIGGDFDYRTEIGGDLKDEEPTALRIIQARTDPNFEDKELYELRVFKDPIGAFEMYVSTPELMALQVMEVSKRHVGKRLAEDDLVEVARALLKRHKNDPFAVLAAVDRVAKKLPRPAKQRKKTPEGKNPSVAPFERFVSIMLPILREQAG